MLIFGLVVVQLLVCLVGSLVALLKKMKLSIEESGGVSVVRKEFDAT